MRLIFVRDVGEIQIAFGVNCGAVGPSGHAGFPVAVGTEREGPLFERAARGVESHDDLIVRRITEVAALRPTRGRRTTDNDLVVRQNHDAPWVDEVAPLRERFAGLVEHLDTAVVAFADIQEAF